jgi:hypothetical protein
MSEKLTPAQRAIRKMEEHKELKKLGYYADKAKSDVEAKLDAQEGTSKRRSKVKVQDQVHYYRALSKLSAEDKEAMKEGIEVMAEAQGKGEAKGKIEAAKEAGLLEQGKGNGKGKVKGKVIDVTPDVPALPA